MVNLELSKTRLTAEIAGFAFYLYELYSFFHTPITGYIYDGSPEIWALRLALLLIAFPILYLFRISYLLGWGDAFSWFLASLNTEEGDSVDSPGEEATGLGISICINFLLGILIIFRLVNYFYKFF
jgi:hypothetical protein